MDNNSIEIEITEEVSEISEETSEAQNSVQLPLNFLSFGEIENDDVKVYIKQDVYKALEELASSDTTKELGSIILGEYSQELGKTHVIISEYVEAKYTDASASTLTFTHETWDYVHKEHEASFPELKIIGWQHTHPNYGIFLSNYDMFIQENFFNMPFQVAYVIDPIQNIRGFFQWKNGKVEKLKGYYIYDEVGKVIKIEQKKIENKLSDKKSSSTVLKATIALLAMICVILGITLACVKSNYSKELAEYSKTILNINSQLASKDETIRNQYVEISNLREYFNNLNVGDIDKVTADKLISDLEGGKLNIDNKDTLLAELKAYVKNGDANSTVYFETYTVKNGDNLSAICKKNNIDYSSSIKMIMAMNGIENPDKIYVGQSIILPVTK